MRWFPFYQCIGRLHLKSVCDLSCMVQDNAHTNIINIVKQNEPVYHENKIVFSMQLLEFVLKMNTHDTRERTGKALK